MAACNNFNLMDEMTDEDLEAAIIAASEQADGAIEESDE